MKRARVTVIVVGHGKRAGDEFTCRRHYEVCQAVGEGCEGEKGQRCSYWKTCPPGQIGPHALGLSARWRLGVPRRVVTLDEHRFGVRGLALPLGCPAAPL